MYIYIYVLYIFNTHIYAYFSFLRVRALFISDRAYACIRVRTNVYNARACKLILRNLKNLRINLYAFEIYLCEINIFLIRHGLYFVLLNFHHLNLIYYLSFQL